MRNADGTLPNNLIVAEPPLAGADGIDTEMILADGAHDIKQAVSIRGTAYDGETVVRHPPQFRAGREVIRRNVVGTRANELWDAVNGLNERRGISHFCDRPLLSGGLKVRPWLLPLDFPRQLVEGDNELLVDTIAGENQQVAMKNRRTGSSLDHVVFERSIFP